MRNELPHEIVLLEGPDEEGVAADILRAAAQQSPGIAIPGLYSMKLTGPLSEAGPRFSSTPRSLCRKRFRIGTPGRRGRHPRGDPFRPRRSRVCPSVVTRPVW